MKIMVSCKRVVDAYAKIRVKTDQSGIEMDNVKMAINPFDEIALEQALQLKEAGLAEEVIVVAVGVSASQEQCRAGLAMGADRAILVESDRHLEPLNVAKILQVLVEREQPGLFLMGKQSIDGDHNQTGQMLAGLLNWPQATNASKVTLAADNIEVEREVDDGIETVRCHLPAVVTVDLRLNVPRYASLPSIMKAKQKPLECLTIPALGLALQTHIEPQMVSAPASRPKGEMLPDVDTLVSKLRQEAKVI